VPQLLTNNNSHSIRKKKDKTSKNYFKQMQFLKLHQTSFFPQLADPDVATVAVTGFSQKVVLQEMREDCMEKIYSIGSGPYIVGGIGDSGTRGVHFLMQKLGVYMQVSQTYSSGVFRFHFGS
jgi:hypothetical protein